MSKEYTETIRIYKGSTIIGFMKIREDLMENFRQMVENGADFEPCFNMVDEFTPKNGEYEAKYEYNKLMHFQLARREEV